MPGGVGAAILALNNAHATELSWLEPARLATLIDRAFYACRIGQAEAFLLAFDQHADYDSPNYLWFRQRFSTFVYVDRVAVSPPARGRGHARRLYADLIRHAMAAGHVVVVCEVNAEPPNPASDAFHASLGFTEAGCAANLHDGRTVRYLTLAIASGPEIQGASIGMDPERPIERISPDGLAAAGAQVPSPRNPGQ